VQLKEQAALIQKVNDKRGLEQTCATNGQQSLERQHFTISRHASPRGGFLFHQIPAHQSLRLAPLEKECASGNRIRSRLCFMRNDSS